MTVLPVPPTCLHDVARCLALAHLRRLRLGSAGRLARESGDLLAAHVGQAGDAVYPTFLCDWLMEAGLLRQAGPRVQPTEAAYGWLAQPAALQVRDLRRAWFNALDLTWRWLPGDRRVRAPSIHWLALILTALDALAVPPDETTVAGLLARLNGEGLLLPRGAAQNLPAARRAVVSRVRRVLTFLLTDVLPALALADVESSDGTVRARLTPEGAVWLRAVLAVARHDPAVDSAHGVEQALPESALAFAPTPTRAVTVNDDGRIVIDPAAPASCVFDISLFARLLSPAPPARYQLRRAAFSAALSRGTDAADLLFRLARYTDGALPSSFVETLRAWQQETARITWTPGYRLASAHPAAFTALHERRAFRERTTPLGGDDVWVARSDARPVLRYLRRLGYLVAPAPDAWGAGPAVPVPPAVLPVADLLVILRTYTALRRVNPGLARLSLDALDKALADALPPDGLAGVERLVASHTALLARRPDEPLGRTPGDDDQAPPNAEAAQERQAGDTDDLAELRQRLQAAVDAGASLRLTYVDSDARVTQRRVRPQRLETRWGREYLVAMCELRQDERSFRLDRILAIR